MKNLVGKKITEKVEFMGEQVEVRKMSVNDVFKIQDLVKNAQKSKDEKQQLNLLKDIIRISVVGAEELTNDDFDQFPLAELNQLSEKVLEISGMGGNTPKGN